MWRWLLIAAVVLVLFLGDGNPVDGVADLIARITDGPRLTHANYNSATGVVMDSPEALAETAGTDIDSYALARMIRSENGRDSNLVKAAIAAAAVNYAASVGQTISAILLRAKVASHNGYFGAEADLETTFSNGKHPSDRYASTRQDPYEGDLQIALGVLDGSIGDVTNGATNFDEPGGDDNPAQTATNRLTAGLVAKPVNGIDSDVLRFWGPA